MVDAEPSSNLRGLVKDDLIKYLETISDHTCTISRLSKGQILSEIMPLIILGVGILTVISMIMILRINAFIALITAAIIVSLLAPGDPAERISRVAVSFGRMAGTIGIVIALAAVVGECMKESGAADRVVLSFLSLFGEKRGATALMSSGFIISIPVFVDTVLYLLLPLAASMHGRTRRHYLKYILAIGAGGIVTHSLVPPTPGPLVMAENLRIELGTMIIIGLLVGFPAALVGLLFAGWADRRMNVPMRIAAGDQPQAERLVQTHLPNLLPSVLPIMLPVVMISANTIMSTVAKTADVDSGLTLAAKITSVVGNANLALLISTAIAMWVLYKHRRMSREKMAKLVERSLMSGGMIILITSAGGAFGAMLKAAQIGPAIKAIFTGEHGQYAAGIMLLGLAFLVSVILKITQGSGTVAMVTTSAMLAAMITSPQDLGYHPVYLATAIGSGSMVGSWMNDSAFWIFAKMGRLTEREALQSWTVMLVIIGLAGLVATILFASILPLASS